MRYERNNRTIRKSSDMNTTVNGSSCSNPFNSTAAKIGITFAYCLIFIVSLLGNSFIGIIVYKTQTLRKPINFFIVNMAMSDLLYPIFHFPWRLTDLHADSWLISGSLGQALRKLLSFLSDVSSGVSVQSLILIAVDRFGAVVFPHRSPLISSKLCPFFILGTWIIALAVHSPYLVAFKLAVYRRGQLVCVLRWNEAFGESSSLANYFIALSVVLLYIPIAMLTILYSIIVIKLKSQKIPGEQSAIAEQQRAKRNRNVLKMAIAIVLGFVLCWVPLSITTSVRLTRDSLPCGFNIVWYITWFMAVSNCAINPCICFILRSNYRNALKRLLRCFSCAGQDE